MDNLFSYSDIDLALDNVELPGSRRLAGWGSRLRAAGRALLSRGMERPRATLAVMGACVVAVLGIALYIALGSSAEHQAPVGGGTSSPATPRRAPSRGDGAKQQHHEQVSPRPRRPDAISTKNLKWAMANLAAGQLRRAEEQALVAVKRDRRAGRPHLVLGHIYFQKLWYSDAIKEYSRAVSNEPGLRADATMLSKVIHCLSRRSLAHKVNTFLIHKIGEPALPALRRAVKNHKNPDVRRRAAWVLQRLES